MLKFEDREKNIERLLKHLIVNKKIKLDHNETSIVNIDSEEFTTSNIKIELLDLGFTVNIQVTYIDSNGTKCTPIFQQHEIYNLCYSVVNSLSKSVIKFDFLYDNNIHINQLYHKHFEDNEGDARIMYIELLYKEFDKLLMELKLIKSIPKRVGYFGAYSNSDHIGTIYYNIQQKAISDNQEYKFINVSLYYFIFAIVADYALKSNLLSKDNELSDDKKFTFSGYLSDKKDIDYMYIYYKITSIYNKELFQIQEKIK